MDTRTEQQKVAMRNLMRQLKVMFPKAVVKGHRDLSPDADKDGVVEKHEWLKECPCFSATAEYEGVGSDTAKGGALIATTRLGEVCLQAPKLL